jgi:DNA-binding transcriptional ArsR family regulator
MTQDRIGTVQPTPHSVCATVAEVPAADYELAATGRAIAEPARAAMLVRMMDGQAHTARDLAEAAGISPSTASPHLRQLIDAGLVIVTVAGRRRLHSLTSPEVAAAIEALAVVSPLLPVESLRRAPEAGCSWLGSVTATSAGHSR